MPSDRSSWITRRVGIHYAWVIAAVTFVVLHCHRRHPRHARRAHGAARNASSAGAARFISVAVAINIALFGLDRSVCGVGDGPLRPAPRHPGSRGWFLPSAVAMTTQDAVRMASGLALVGRLCRRRDWRHINGAGRHRRNAVVRRAARSGVSAHSLRQMRRGSSCSCRSWRRTVEQSGWRTATLYRFRRVGRGLRRRPDLHA